MRQTLIYLFLFTIHGIHTLSINLTFPTGIPENSLLINITDYLTDKQNVSNLKLQTNTRLFSLTNDSIYISDEYLHIQSKYLFLVTYREQDFSLNYILFNVKFESVKTPSFNCHTAHGIVPINSPVFSLVSGLTDVYITCYNGTECFDSVTLECGDNLCPFKLELLPVNTLSYITVYTTEELRNVSTWYLNVTLHNRNQNDIKLELSIDSIYDIFHLTFKKISLQYEFSESTRIGTFLFKPELTNPWSNYSYFYSLQSNLAAFYLKLDSETGDISLRSKFDCEFHSTILVTIEVRFIANISVTVIQSISTANFLINVIDVSEFAPIFSLPIYKSEICTDISTNQFIAFTPVFDNDVTSVSLPELLMEPTSNQSVSFELEHGSVWVGKYTGSGIANENPRTYRIYAVDSQNIFLTSEALILVRFKECVDRSPIFFQNPVSLKVSPLCPTLYQLAYLSDDHTYKINTNMFDTLNESICRIDNNGILNCSYHSGEITVFVKNRNSSLAITFQTDFDNQYAFLYPSLETMNNHLILYNSTEQEVYYFGNTSSCIISGLDSPVFIENSVLKLSQNVFPGEYILDVICTESLYAIPFRIFPFRIEIHSAFPAEKVALNFPFSAANTSVYIVRPEFGAFTYQILNKIGIPLAFNNHSGILYTTREIRKNSQFLIHLMATSKVDKNLTQNQTIHISFSSAFQRVYYVTPKRITVNLPKLSDQEIYRFNFTTTTKSIKILGENNQRLFSVSGLRILLKNSLYFAPHNLTLSLQISSYNSSSLISNSLHNIRIIFTNSSIFPINTLPNNYKLKLPICTPNYSHIFKLPSLPTGEFKMNSTELKITANGSLIYTGSRPAYSPINQSIFFLHGSVQYLFAHIRIDFIDQSNESEVSFSINSDTQIGTKVGRIWNQTQEACTYFKIAANVPFHIDSATGDIFVSSYLEEIRYQFNVDLDYFCQSRVINVTITIVPVSYINIFTHQTYTFSYQRENSSQFIGQITTNNFSTPLEIFLVTNSLYTSYFQLQNGELYTNGFSEKTDSILLIAKACIPSTQICSYAHIQLHITPSNDFPPKFSYENLNIYIPSSQPSNTQIFQLTSYDIDIPFDHLRFSLSHLFINITQYGTMYLIATPLEGSYVIDVGVIDISGAQSNLPVYIHIYKQFIQSIYFPDLFNNFSIDPILNREFELTPIISGIYGYTLLFTNPSDALAVNKSGFLSVINTQTDSIQTILIVYSIECSHFGATFLQVNIINPNHAPQFPAQTATIYIYTNASISSNYDIPKAIDTDLDSNGIVTYSIESYSHGIPRIFTLDSVHGFLTLIRNLTEFQFHNINITIRATDEGNPPLSDDVILTINIKPAVIIEFGTETETYNITVPNTSALFRIQTTNQLDNVSITIVNIVPENHFFIDTAGYVYVRTQHAQFQFQYTLVVVAKLRLSAAILEVLINVDFTFEFASDSYQTFLPENLALNTVIFQPDIVSVPLEVYYYFDAKYSEFSVNSSRHVSLVAQLDFEKTQFYILQLNAYSPFLNRIVFTTLFINISDINDNKPVFLGTPPYIAYIFAFAVHREIYRFHAFDMDSGENGSLTFRIEQSSVGNIFTVSDAGLVSFLNFPISYQTGYSLVLVAADNGVPSLATRVLLTISVHHNIPNNLPVFEHEIYKVSIKENFVDFNRAVTYIRAFSPFPVVYKIVENSNDFIIHIGTATQNIFIRSVPDFELSSRHVFNISANDGNSTQFCLFIINILDANDNKPVFSKQIYQTTIQENNNVGDIVLSLNVSDTDSSSNGEISLSFKDENLNSFFDIIGTNLVAKVSFDFEKNRSFEFEIFAVDHGEPVQSSSCSAIVAIENLNDNPPMVPIGTKFIVYLPENATEQNIFSIPASDEDNLPLYFAIQNDYTYFAITEKGVLYLVSSPLRGTYQLSVDVTDGIHSILVPISVLVGNVNENPPKIDQSTCRGSLFENAPNDTFVTQITADDLDVGHNSDISFLILTNFDVINDGNLFENIFKIDSKTGIITTNFEGDILVGEIRTLIDAEFNSEINLDVIAIDGGGLEDFCRVTISILDLNDNSPSFDRDFYAVTYKQIIQSTQILTVYAFDPDQGTNGMIRYNLKNANGFIIESTSGIIISIDSISSGNYSFSVSATDGGTPFLQSTAQIQIIVQQDLPTPPIFAENSYSVSVFENQSLHSVILQVNASTDDNTFLIYSIRSSDKYRGNSEGTFLINGITGEISLAQHLDFERLVPCPCFFQILAKASNFESSSFVYVYISVRDVNDNYPIFKSPILEFKLSEENPKGTFVGRLVAQDSDSGLNGEIEYFVHDTSLSIPFVVNLDGSILSDEVLDHEDPIGSNLYSFICVARDKCGTDCSLSRVVSVVIKIKDINDNSPVFSSDIPNNLSIFEDIVPPKDLTVLTATDKDSLSIFKLTFSIVFGNINSVFSINHQTGHLSLVRTLDYETETEYNLTVSVCDGVFCPRHNLRISVLNIDDSIPIFSQENYYFHIPESSIPGTPVLTVTATDIDLPANTFLVYEISEYSTASNYFSINNRTGVLQTISQIDREEYSTFEFYCFARDSNNNRGKAVIHAEISDINESPFFSKAFYETQIDENLPIETFVGQFLAIDRDNGTNATLQYELELNDNNAFRIDPITGYLFTQQIFDFEETTSYLLILRASDSGTPSLTATTQIQIFIQDINDHIPYFLCQQMYSRVYDNAVNNSVVTKIRIFDQDEVPNFSIQLLTPDLPFVVSRRTGEVLLVDYLTENSYILEVLLSDFSLNFTEIGNFTITVLPTNKSPPIYTGSSDVFSILIGSNIGAEIGTISAEDPDGEKLNYFLNDTNFRIDSQTGTITLNMVPNSVTSHYVNVTLLDLGYPQLSTDISIIISVENYFENRIIFTENFYSISIEEGSLFSDFLQVRVLDIFVNYQIVENFSSFSINSSSGEMSLITPLDREFQSTYNITIIATSEIGMFGSTYILIKVLDLNDNPTRETNSNLLIRLQLTQTVSVPIPFDDPDSNDHFQNCSYLSGSMEFEISSDCHIQILHSLNSGIFSIDIIGTDGIHEYATNHITIDIGRFQSLVPERIFSFILQNPLGDVIQNISILQTQIDRIFTQKIVIFSIEENMNNTLINLFTEDSVDTSLVLYTIYSNRDTFSEIGFSLESIQSKPCDMEPCANQGVCNNSLSFGTISHVSYKQNIFISPYVAHSYECICALGSAGKDCDINIDDCLNIFCQNGAKCVDLLQDFYCECPEGVFGKYCENTISHCATNSCQNGGICVEKITHFECECGDDFYGETCQFSFTRMTDLCATIECQNNSTCTSSKWNYTCTCQVGFSGESCGIHTNGSSTPCSSNPCRHGGVCIGDLMEPQSYKCLCVDGYTGTDCCYPLDACEMFPCKNGGVCRSGFFGDYICKCPIALSGANCEIFDTIGVIENANCPIGYVGGECHLPAFPPNSCLSNGCQNGAICSYGFENYTCSCQSGFSGDLCQFSTQFSGPCDSNPCRHNGKCIQIGTEFKCECIIGVAGQYCETNINECGTETCGFGTCIDGFGAFKCDCQDGYLGVNCATKCPIGTAGHNCNMSKQFCDERSCPSTFECVEVSDGFECLCPIGFGGINCDTPLSCDNTECVNGGTCHSGTIYGFNCVCKDKFWGQKCELLRSTSFGGRSFIRFQGSILPNQNAAIDFSLSTASGNGLVLFATNYRDFGHEDFIVVDITNSIIRLTLSFGGDNYVVVDCANTLINDGSIHAVSLSFSMNRISICVDDCPKNCEIRFDSVHNSIDGVIAVFLGGIPFDPSVKISQNFTGCLQDLYINKQQIDLSDGYHFQTIEMCPDVVSSPCGPIKCPTRSSCVETNHGPICTCNHGYFGSNCEEIVPPITLETGDYIQIVSKNRITRDLSYLDLLLKSFSVSILPSSQTGTILSITDASHYLKLELTPTHMELTTDTSSVSVPITNISIPWYQISFQIERNIITLNLNDEKTELELNTLHILNGEFSSIFIGGAETGIHGCIQDIRLNEYQLQASNPAFQLVPASSDTNSIPTSGCQAACTNSSCGFGECVPLSTQKTGFICHCTDNTFQPVCPSNEQNNAATYILLLVIAFFIILLFTIIFLVVIFVFYGHKHFDREKLYMVQVYGNEISDTTNHDAGIVRVYAYDGGGQSEPKTETKPAMEPSILSDEVTMEIPKYDVNLCRSLMFRREAFLCDDDSRRAHSDSEGEELLTSSLSRDSELNLSNLVPIETLQELGSPFKQLVSVIYPEFDNNL